MDIVLVHPVIRPPSKLVAFYDGHVVARDGVIRIPYDGERSIRWAKNAFLNGYRASPDGYLYRSWEEVQRMIDDQRSAESWETGPEKTGPATALKPEEENTKEGAAKTGRVNTIKQTKKE